MLFRDILMVAAAQTGGAAAGGRILPVIQNGGFSSGANWTIVQPGTATLGISGNALNAAGGTSPTTTTCTQTLSGLTPGASYTFGNDALAHSAGSGATVSLGGGTPVGIGLTGTGNTSTVVAGSSNSDIVIALGGSMSTGARTWSLTNFSLS